MAWHAAKTGDRAPPTGSYTRSLLLYLCAGVVVGMRTASLSRSTLRRTLRAQSRRLRSHRRRTGRSGALPRFWALEVTRCHLVVCDVGRKGMLGKWTGVVTCIASVALVLEWLTACCCLSVAAERAVMGICVLWNVARIKGRYFIPVTSVLRQCHTHLEFQMSLSEYSYNMRSSYVHSVFICPELVMQSLLSHCCSWFFF